jgi:hypothetical protein
VTTATIGSALVISRPAATRSTWAVAFAVLLAWVAVAAVVATIGGPALRARLGLVRVRNPE